MWVSVLNKKYICVSIAELYPVTSRRGFAGGVTIARSLTNHFFRSKPKCFAALIVRSGFCPRFASLIFPSSFTRVSRSSSSVSAKLSSLGSGTSFPSMVHGNTFSCAARVSSFKTNSSPRRSGTKLNVKAKFETDFSLYRLKG
jgi:hypothetical protein